jgi:hypothetical protein
VVCTRKSNKQTLEQKIEDETKKSFLMDGSYLYDSKFYVSKNGQADKKIFEYKVFGTRPDGNGKTRKEKFLG